MGGDFVALFIWKYLMHIIFVWMTIEHWGIPHGW